MTPRWFAVVLLGALAATVAQAGTASGPKEGDKVAPLKVYAVSGDPKDKDVDYADLRKQKPTVYVFVAAKDFDRPMFRFLKKLDESVGDQGSMVAVWLTEDADKAKEYLPKIAQYFNATALTVFRGAAGPAGWGINPDARLTAVVADRGRVIKSFGYVSLNETDAPEVARLLKAETVCYVRRAGATFIAECTFRITRPPSGWTITSWTSRGTVRMEVETRYDAHEQPASARVVLTTDGRDQTAKVVIKDGKAMILRDGKAAEAFDVPKGTIVTSAPDWTDVFLLCRHYDRQRKGTQEFPALWVHPVEPPQRLKFSITWQGSGSIEHHGKKIALSRYGITIRNRSRYVAWADAEGRMVRLLALPLKGTASGLTLEGYEKSVAGLRPVP